MPLDITRPAGGAGATGLPALGRYQLLEWLGTGGLGEVFRARDTEAGRTVLVKRIQPSIVGDARRREEFLRAVRAAAGVSHPGVAGLYEAGEHEGEVFLAIEFVQGETLARALSGRALSPRRAVDVACEIADALASAHDAGVFHGDLRPETVMISTRGHVKLLDCGLSAFTAGGTIRTWAADRGASLPRSAIATTQYLSPEQALGGRWDGRSDIFSLGAMLFTMLTGRPAFDRATPADTVVAVLQSTPPAPSLVNPDLPAALDAIVARAMAKSLEGRYPDARSLAADLRRVREELTVPEPAAPAVATPAAPGRARRLAVGVVMAALAVAAAWWQRDALVQLWQSLAGGL